MAPSAETSLKRMGRCVSDLARNGIDLAGTGRRAMRLLVRRHLDYFQLMLGYDAGPREVVALVDRLRSLPDGGRGRNRVATKPTKPAREPRAAASTAPFGR